MTIKGSKGLSHHYTIAELDWNGHKKTRKFNIASLKEWDVMLGIPALVQNRAKLDAGE